MQLLELVKNYKNNRIYRAPTSLDNVLKFIHDVESHTPSKIYSGDNDEYPANYQTGVMPFFVWRE
jgi:hypothetical protein